MIYAYLPHHLIAPIHKNTERNTFRLVWFSTRSIHSKFVRKYIFSYQSKYLCTDSVFNQDVTLFDNNK
jgi:hypothetical protein